ncbi:hypothetical protein ATJ88_1734 [Isoptericola jiangsuensis]|uniref:Uncharacterized protein n=1 Tax=Isoptericola jiangsuensis TaxID=548579 RepID=A0A2A9EXL4_9MICO|nr:hypothetical protein ATJ88_1734 [Isoptericola jiangsuensis]
MDSRKVIATARHWAISYSQVEARRTVVRLDAEHALDALKGNFVAASLGGEVVWRVLPLGANDASALRAVSRAVTLAPIEAEDREAVRQLADEVPEALAEAEAVSGARRLLATPAVRQAGAEALEFLTEYVTWGLESGLPRVLRRLEPGSEPEDITVTDALSPRVGLGSIWRGLGAAELVDASALPAASGATVSAADVDLSRLRPVLATGTATHLVVFSTAPHRATELVTALQP